ncbi:hypothetical protein Tco_0221577 [Tanacetum coccineum]
MLDKLEKSKSYEAAENHRNLYDALIKSYQLDKDLFDSYGKAYSLKRSHEDKDKDEDPPAGSDQGLKKKKASKDSVQAEEPVFETADTEMPQDQGGDTEDQPNVEANTMNDCRIAQAKKPPLMFDELMSTHIDFSAYVMHNLKIDNLTQDILQAIALPLIEAQGRQVVPADYFFNNDLEYLKGGSASRKESKHDVFSRKRIIAVTHVKVMKWYGYGYLEEIIGRREDQTLHKFKEEKDVIFDLNVALRMFTRCIVIIKRVEDHQLGVESYQKKLNITKPETFRSSISKLTPYTAYKNPQGIIYQDKLKRNMLMRSDELYKFYDGTLSSVQRILHDIASNLEMDYLPKRRWSNLDRKGSCIMIKAIDQQLFERILMRSLEKFVGGREYRNDFRLLERTI